MTALLETMATNAILATVLALIVFGLSRFVTRPAVVYWLWVLVLLKLVTPPILHLPLKWNALKPNDVAAAVIPKEKDSHSTQSTQQPVLLSAEEPENVTSISAVIFLDGPTEMSARPSGESTKDLFTVESTVAPSAIPSNHPAGTLWETPLRWSWSLVLGSLWLLGSGLWFVLATIRIHRFGRHVRRAKPASEWLQQEAVALAHRFGLRQCPQIVTMPGRVPPLLWSGQRSPVVAIPAELLKRLEPVEQVMVVAHELAHFRRRDHWFRWVEMVILGLYCWHPVAWWARRKLQEAEEQCCDAWVLWAFPERPQSYARALLNTMEFLSPSRTSLPAGASGLGTVYCVKRRFEMILQNRVDRQTSWPVRFGLIVFACVALSLSARLTQADSQKSESAEESAVKNTIIRTDSNTQNLPPGEVLQSHPVLQTEHAADMNAVVELINAINESNEEYQRQAKEQRETVAELEKLGVGVWQYESNRLGKLNRQLPAPIRDGFLITLGHDMFHSVSRVSITKPLDDEGLQKVLLRLKSFPQLNQVSSFALRHEQIGQVKAVLPKVTVENAFPFRPDAAEIARQSYLFAPSTGLPVDSAQTSTTSTSLSSQSVKHQVLHALIAALKDEDEIVRRVAANALVKGFKDSREAMSALAELLSESDDPELLKYNIVALEGIDEPYGKMISLLVSEALKDIGEDATKIARTTLQKWGARSPDVATALIEAVKKETDETRRQYAGSFLSSIQPASESVVTVLVKALKDEDPNVRLHAASALGQIREDLFK